MTAHDVEYGAHLPLVDLGAPRSLPALGAYVRTAARLGYRYLCANDHLVFDRPWLDGPTALAALIEASRDMTLVTTAGLAVLRGPVQLAKTLTAIDILSGGRLVAGVGPGSSAGDYAAAGIGFQERWRRFEEAGRAPEPFPSAIATTWLHVTEDKGEAERMLGEVLAPMLHRPPEELRSAPLLIGPAEVCAERLTAWVDAGARRIFVWPLGDELAQLERFRERVAVTPR